eukprot:IDg18174t1
MQDVRRSGDSLQLAFARLKRRARRLQKTLGEYYDSDGALCDFYRRSLQTESFWAYMDDSDPQLTSEALHGKIELAMEKYSRINKSARNLKSYETLASSVEERRWGKPNQKRSNKLNPTYKDGTVMTCTGCGSKYHFYRECEDPNKKGKRATRLDEIARMKSGKQKKNHHSYFLQLDESDDEHVNENLEHNINEDDIHSSADEDIRRIAD